MKYLLVFVAIGLCVCAHPYVLTAQIVNVEDQRITGTQDSIHWYGNLDASAALSKVEEQSFQMQGQGKVEYKNGRHLTLLLLNLNLLQAGHQDFARQAFAHLRYNYKWSDTWIWEAFTQIQTSPIQQLQQRNLIGTGIRCRLFKSADNRRRVYLGSALLLEQNRFTDVENKQILHRSSNYVSLTLSAGSHVTLVTTTYWQPVLGLIKNYRLSMDWLLKVGITKKLALTVNFNYAIDKNLPVGAPGETYAWQNGISLQL